MAWFTRYGGGAKYAYGSELICSVLIYVRAGLHRPRVWSIRGMVRGLKRDRVLRLTTSFNKHMV